MSWIKKILFFFKFTISSSETIESCKCAAITLKSLSDVGSYSGDLDFDKQVKGILVIGGNKFKSEFLFNVRKENNSNSFTGMLMFNGEDVFKNTNGIITIMIKGRQ